MLRPDLELAVVGGQGLEMLRAARRQRWRRTMRRGPARRRSDTPPARTMRWRRPEQRVAPSLPPRRPPRSRRRGRAPAACGSSTSRRQSPDPGCWRNGARTAARRTAHRRSEPNVGVRPRSVRIEPELRGDDVDDETEPRLLREVEALPRPRAAPRRADRPLARRLRDQMLQL